jgi:hypothetical protein
MHGITRMITVAAMSLMALNSPVLGGESCKFEGRWRLVAIHAEDIGERRSGYMTMSCDGRFGAWIGTAQSEPIQSIWEDVARTFSDPALPNRATYYSGSYRLDAE